jgi:hypothetical protein
MGNQRRATLFQRDHPDVGRGFRIAEKDLSIVGGNAAENKPPLLYVKISVTFFETVSSRYRTDPDPGCNGLRPRVKIARRLSFNQSGLPSATPPSYSVS